MANPLPDDIPALTDPAAQRLNQRQQLNYTNHRQTVLNWLLHLGKDPQNTTGYSKSTVKRDAYRLDQFYRWVWEQEDGFTTAITHDHADAYVDHLAYGETSNSHNAKCVKALKRLFKWQHHERDGACSGLISTTRCCGFQRRSPRRTGRTGPRRCGVRPLRCWRSGWRSAVGTRSMRTVMRSG